MKINSTLVKLIVGKQSYYPMQILLLLAIFAFSSKNIYAQTYCTPTFSTGCTDDDFIEDFSIDGDNGTSIYDLGTGCSTGSYDDKTSLPAVDLTPSVSYITTVSAGTTGNNCAIWIDFDDDEIFQSSEMVGFSTTGITEFGSSVVISIPTSANPGIHRMRVMLAFDNDGDPASFDPCNTSYILAAGEVHDYMVDIQPLANCTGTPTAGTVMSSLKVCPNTNFSVITTGATIPANGLDRHWESSTDGVSGWTVLTDSYSTEYVVNGGISDTLYYRYIVTCTNSSDSDTSGVIAVTFNPPSNCYCEPTYDMNCINYDRIAIVYLAGETVTLNNKTQCSNSGYGIYTNLPQPDLIQGNAYAISVSSDATVLADIELRVWIDYNQNGVFEDGEEIGSTAGFGMGSGTRVANFTVPASIPNGTYRLRVRLVNSPAGAIDPCANEVNGETEDYLVFINTPCTNPSVNLGADTVICQNDSIVLDAGNPGLSYQWNSGPITQTITVNQAGTYIVKVKVDECVTADTIIVSYASFPLADSITITETNDCMFELGLANVVHTNNVKWSFGDGSATVTTQTATHAYSEVGQYQVKATLYNDCDSAVISRVIKCSALGISSVDSDFNRLKLYPNPATNDVIIESNASLKMNAIKVVNTLGQTVLTTTLQGATVYQLDVSTLSNGLYTVIVSTDNKNYTRRIEVLK